MFRGKNTTLIVIIGCVSNEMNQDRERWLVCVGAGEELAKTTLSTWKSAGKEKRVPKILRL